MSNPASALQRGIGAAPDDGSPKRVIPYEFA